MPYNAVHWPFQPPDRPDQVLTKKNMYDGTRQDYAAMLERVDQGVGQMLAALEKQGVVDNTLFIFSSDNGGERLSEQRAAVQPQDDAVGGRHPRAVPDALAGPAAEGKVLPQPAITMDLTATILAAAGSSAANGPQARRHRPAADPDGKQPEVGADVLLAHRPRGPQAEGGAAGNWKYVQDDMLEMLFDLEKDISERQDLAYRQPEVLARLKRLLHNWEADLARDPPSFVVRR